MKFNIVTFGCKVNSYESEYMREQLEKEGYQYIDDYKNSDIVIVNTCSVTNMADNKSKKMIRNIRRDNSDAILMVCGCTAENHRDELDELDIDILIGNKDKSKVVELINEYKKSNSKYKMFYNERRLDFEDMEIDDFSLTRAFVKIQDGCNNYCAYCIIPYVRGSIRSKPIEEAIKEIERLVDKGHKEIVFTGINTGAYGKEIGKYDLTDLIREISKFDKLERIRVSSIEITEINDKFIEELKNNKKLCGHLHVSLQSGCSDVLKRMNRKYTNEEYLEKVNKIRKVRPDINLTTDVIVGFPGESEDNFLECVEFCKKVGFSKIHVFPYSIRKGTKAAEMEDQVPNEIKKDRARRLIEIDKKLQYEYNNIFLNKVVSVLIEECNDNISIGHTENFLKVLINEKLDINKNYNILITEIRNEEVIGVVE